MITGIVSGLLLTIASLLSVMSYSLRNFHRSQLAQVCRQHRNEQRFATILRDDEIALQSTELLFLLLLPAGVCLTVISLTLEQSTVSAETILELALAGICLWAAASVIPWILSRVWGEQLLYRLWPFVHLVMQISRPLRAVANFVDKLMHRLAGREDPTPDNLDTIAEEIQSVVDEGEREGVLESRSSMMIQRVMELGEEDVRAVMTPRIDMISISVNLSLQEARTELLEAGHSRIPVIDTSPDDIVGILYARDLLEHIGNCDEQVPLRKILREPFYVPETTTVDALLERMKLERLHMAIVLDEYGGVTGLVTLEDILEEIVGDIADEFDDVESASIRHVDAHTIEVDARTHLDELNDLFDLDLPDEADFDTVGGFVFNELGRIPQKGEVVSWNNLRITVVEASDRSIVRVNVTSDVPWPAPHATPPQKHVPANKSTSR